MMRFAFIAFLYTAYSEEISVINDVSDIAAQDVVGAENMPDPDDLNAPAEDLSIADKVAAEDVDESSNDIDGNGEETEAQPDSDQMDTFTDTVQSEPADDSSDDKSVLETYSDTVEPQAADDTTESSDIVVAQPTDDTTETPKETLAGLEVNSSLSVAEATGKFEPYDGMEIPSFVGTFPGCTCTFSEHKRRWKCKGTIAHPPPVAGDECCCCKLSCQWRNRCTNEQCEAIGIDQAEEVAEEERRMKELMKGADMLLGDSLPGFITELPKGHCTHQSLTQACREKGLTPLCDHPNYAKGQCYTPGKTSGNKFHGRHFSHWSSHRQYFGIEDDYLFYGMCFYAVGNGNWNLAPCNGNSHCWTNGNHRLSPPARVLAMEPVPNIHFHTISNCQGGLGCWKTICVKENPN